MVPWEVHKEPHNKPVHLLIRQVPTDCLRYIIRNLQQQQLLVWKTLHRIRSKLSFLLTTRKKVFLISQMSLRLKTSQLSKNCSKTQFTPRKWLLYLSNLTSRRSVIGPSQEREEEMIGQSSLMMQEIKIVLKTFLDLILTGKQGRFQIRDLVPES